MPDEIIPRLVTKLRVGEPPAGELRLAAVAVILRDREAPSTLLIKRADRTGDPWSGQIAFPGGKTQQGDIRARDTAARETFEEVGIDLEDSAEFLGYAENIRTHTGTMDVVPSVFLLRREVQVRPNGEVSSHRWVELGSLGAPQARSAYRMNFDGKTVEMPALAAGDYIIWGLTYRIVNSLLRYSGLL